MTKDNTGKDNDVCNNQRKVFRGQDARNNNSSNQESHDNGQAGEAKDEGQNAHKQGTKQNGPSEWIKLFFQFIGPITVVLLSFYLDNVVANNLNKEDSIEQPSPTPEATKSPFSIDMQFAKSSPIKYVEYTLVSDPVVPRYQVKPYPYIAVLGLKGWTYIPVLGLYTQEQYTADFNGICKLEREDIMTQLQDISAEVGKEIGTEYKTGCYFLIGYVARDGSKESEIYEFEKGNLTSPDAAESLQVIAAYKNDTHIKINVVTWPSNKEQVLETINSL